MTQEFMVAVVYVGTSKKFIPSRWYKICAARKSTAEKRALLKARAEMPLYTKFIATADSWTYKKIRAIGAARRRLVWQQLDELTEAEETALAERIDVWDTAENVTYLDAIFNAC